MKKLDHSFERPLASSGAAEDDPSGSHWLRQCSHRLLGPLFWGWFRAKTQEECEWRYPTGPCTVRTAGIDLVRILIIGDGPAAGCGVRTHDLGIAGHLARYIAARIDRGVVVTVMARPGASARTTLKRLDEVDLEGYDTILLMLATTDAFCLTKRRSWRGDMTELIRALNSTHTASLFVTSTANLHVARSLSPLARCLTGNHGRMLNIETSGICAQFNTPMINLDAASNLTSRTYKRWGRRIGAHVVAAMLNSSSAIDNVDSGAACRT